MYFVHGFAAAPDADVLATCDYGGEFAAVVQRGNFFGTQFHPERSAGAGRRLLANFLALPGMELMPAIDLRGGRCVRLLQGRFDAETCYADDPLSVLAASIGHGARAACTSSTSTARATGRRRTTH